MWRYPKMTGGAWDRKNILWKSNCNILTIILLILTIGNMNTVAFALKKSVRMIVVFIAVIVWLMTSKVIGFALIALTISKMNSNGEYEPNKH